MVQVVFLVLDGEIILDVFRLIYVWRENGGMWEVAFLSKKIKVKSSNRYMGVEVEAKGFNPGLIVLLLVCGLMLVFLVGNYLLYMYAQKTLPPQKKKPVSKKKMKRERLKQGVSAPGE
ncbi:hypothetical protein ACH5RR_004757 [Cinchona calisaya]|uniref:DNA-binding protein S1FA n=1 Tax=Cinchona calisaya TaxID=153742 RepID=A0ABD3AYL4_9GENT